MSTIDIYKVTWDGNSKVVVIEFGYDDSIPLQLRGIELCLHQSTGPMAIRMRAANYIKKILTKHGD